jgi:anti-sigma factor RsiW
MTNRPSTLPPDIPEHHLEWNDRLQDWLDGDASEVDGTAVEEHLNDCQICQQRLAEFQQLETALFNGSSAPSLVAAAFDTRLFAQIDVVDEAQRAAARQRVEQELQANLQALSRSWRRALAFVIPGIIGGIALAFAMAGYFEASGLAGKLVAEGASEIGANAGVIQTMLTALMGAGIGGVLAGWLAKVAD